MMGWLCNARMASTVYTYLECVRALRLVQWSVTEVMEAFSPVRRHRIRNYEEMPEWSLV
jgi:hypothetical protein